MMSSCMSHYDSFVNIDCAYTFKNVRSQEDQKKLENAIATVVGTEYRKTGTDVNPTYYFKVAGAKQIDQIHNNLIAIKGGSDGTIVLPSNITGKKRSSTFYIEKPEYKVLYGTIGLNAQIEVILKFQITPGSQLWYKAEGMQEEDISSKVDSEGNVRFSTKIYKNQEYILGRTSYKGAERFIKVNIFTGTVTEINSSEY
jgi:hypothetical protein